MDKKNSSGLFDVTTGSYDDAETCELVGIYILHKLADRIKKEDTGLYRDDGLILQGWIGYAGTHVHVPMSVPRLGLIKPGQTYACPKLWAFSIKIRLWLILHFFENRRLVCLTLRAFSELFVSSHCQ